MSTFQQLRANLMMVGMAHVAQVNKYRHKGPTLAKAILGGTYKYHYDMTRPSMIEEITDGEDILEIMQRVYGPDHNWNGREWRYRDFLEAEDAGKTLYLQFVCSKNGKSEEWLGSVPDDLSAMMHTSAPMEGMREDL